MTATYVAWNGKPYPSPPPDGWYEASDGRWWAPGTGPNPPPTPTPNPASTPSASSTDQAQGQATNGATGATAATANQRVASDAKGERAATVKADAHRKTTAATPVPAALAGPQATRPQKTTPKRIMPAADAAADREQHTVLTRQPLLDSSQKVAEPVAIPPALQGKSGDRTTARKQQAKRNRTQILLMGVVAFGLAAAAGFIYLAFGQQSDDDSEPAIATEASASTTAPSSAAASPSTVSIPETADDANAESTAAEAAATSSTSTGTSETSTSTPPTSATEATGTETAPAITASQEELVTQFRAQLDANDLSSAQLTSADIIDFGNSFCTFAIISGDADAFDVYRQKALDESNGELTTAELTIAIDEVVKVFCPQHAARLGIT